MEASNVKKISCCLLIFLTSAGLAAAEQSEPPREPTLPSVHLQTESMRWEPAKEIPGFPTGRLRKFLHLNDETGAGVAMIKHPAGFVEPQHYHTTGAHSIYVLEGQMMFGEIRAGAGDFLFTPAWQAHGPIEILEETTFLIWSDGPLDINFGTPGASLDKD
jgi:quercetin dioxygenase-like cupin family protein